MKHVLLFCAAVFLFAIATTAVAQAQVAVIANKDIAAASINATTLKNLYSLATSDVDGKKVKLFDLGADSPTKDKFFGVIGKPSTEMRKVWLKAKLTGNGTPPEAAASDDDMLAKVSSTPGGIGYVPKSKAGGNVKVLMVIE